MTSFYSGIRYWITPLILIGFSGSLHAAWNNVYGVNASVGYDSNFRLTEEDEIETSQTTASLQARAENTSQTTNLAISSSIGGNDYSDSEIDGESFFDLDVNWIQNYERSNYSLGAAYMLEPTAETEVLDTGAIVDGSRDTVILTGGYRYDLSQSSTISLDASFSDVTYDSDLFNEFQEANLFINYNLRADSNSSWTYSLGYTDFDPELNEEAETLVATIGYQLSTSAATDMNFTLGYTDVSGGDDASDGGVFSFTVTNASDQRNTYSLSLTRDILSGGGGELREQDTLELDWNHRISDRLSFDSSIVALSSNLRDYGELGFGFTHRLSNRTNIGGSYRYRDQENDTEEASSNSVFFSIATSFQ